MKIRNGLLILAALAISACSFSDDDDDGGNGPASCSNGDQKRYVRDAMQGWYLWNDLLPNKIPVSDYETPEALVADLMNYSLDDGNGNPVDRFSFVGSAAEDAAFFGAGQFEGFGFGTMMLASDDVRLTRVFANSPAEMGGLMRGQRILELDGRTIAEIEAAEGLDVVFDTTPLTFLIEEPGGTQFATTIAQDVVTIDPIPQYRVIAANDGSGRMVGYVELASFIGTANDEFANVFADFVANGVNDVIIDLRYNGGGLVNTANLLGDYLGGDIAANLVFSETLFNDDRAANNNSRSFFDRIPNSMSLSRLVVIATGSTASASELVTNSMAPHVEVTIVGADTFGKPIGQVGFTFCEKILRATAFQTVNADGFGDYFDGIPANCPAADDLTIAVGADTDPNMIAAMEFLATGQCPVVAPPPAAFGLQAQTQPPRPDLRGPPWREFAGAY
ncbi:MAG: S41 family peptidase [Woeseiaceae bacterium]